MGTFEANLAALLQWLLKATLQGSLLVCLILLIKIILRERLAARWHYCLWLVLLLRLILPWAPESRISIYSVIPNSLSPYPAKFDLVGPSADEIHTGSDSRGRESGSGQVSATDQAGTSRQGKASPAKPAATRPPSGTALSSHQEPLQANGQNHLLASLVIRTLIWVWLIGGGVLAGYILIKAFRLWQAVTAERPVTDQEILDLLEDCKMQMGVRTLVGVVLTDKVHAPALFGVVRPRILLPQGLMETLGLDELHYVFLHELAHLKRRDIYLAWLVCLLQVLHWFNPLIWLAFRRMRTDQEMAADTLALTTAGTEESRRYAQTIVNLVERFSRPQYLPSLAGILENPSHIERRIAMITQFKNNSYRWSPLAVALIALLCCVSLVDAGSGKTAQPVSVSVSAEQPAAPVAGGNSVFADPNTGITFRKAKTLSGPSDVITSTDYLQISPSGKFLLSGVKVVPLDGSQPFDLADAPNLECSVLSPDGKKVAFAAGGIWVVPVNPETGRPTGPVERLYEADDFLGKCVAWSADSEKVTSFRRNKEGIWGISVADRSVAKVRDVPGQETPSSDGKHLAFCDPNGLWVRAMEGEQAKKLDDDGRPILWSGDSEWLLYSIARGAPWGHVDRPQFFRVADGRRVKIELPGKGSCVGLSADRKKLFWYCPSYEGREAMEVIPVSGGPICELGRQMRATPGVFFRQFWAPDSRSIVVEGECKGNDRGLWALPLSGDAPIPLRMDISVPGKGDRHELSPGLDYVLVPVKGDDKTYELWGAPVSWKQMRTAGPAVSIFRNWDFTALPTWSPDGRRIAITQGRKGEIWIASVEGGEPVLLTRSPGLRGSPLWSPDGRMIAFHTSLPDKGNVLHVVWASGGEPKPAREYTFSAEIVLVGGARGQVTWSPDGEALTVADERMILSVPISGGPSQPLVNLNNIGMKLAFGLRWSPDRKILTFGGYSSGGPIRAYHSQDGRVTTIADKVIFYFWSPDGKWMSIAGFRSFKARAEGVLWEMDVEEALAKLAK